MSISIRDCSTLDGVYGLMCHVMGHPCKSLCSMLRYPVNRALHLTTNLKPRAALMSGALDKQHVIRWRARLCDAMAVFWCSPHPMLLCRHASLHWNEHGTNTQSCAALIRKQEFGDCEAWYMDYMKCVDDCVSTIAASIPQNRAQSYAMCSGCCLLGMMRSNLPLRKSLKE